MAATTTTTDWKALAQKLWQGAIIRGIGHNAVTVRCFLKTEVHLFDDYAAARAFESAPCCPSCAGKHKWGSLVPYIPAPPARRSIRNRGLLEAE